MRIFSGVQPTGRLHLGNYLGAVRNFVDLQKTAAEPLFCIVDLHAMTLPYRPAELPQRVLETAAAFIASGINPESSIVFTQSSVRQHSELAWILNCTARLGWLDRMTQFKDKAGAEAERESLGLYAYPVLMAADILLYGTTHVPVGDDQRQHLELARQIAKKFNSDHKQPVFVLPEAIITQASARVMSLQDPTRKMSKSDPSEIGRIAMTDNADSIQRKIAKAVTDSGPMPEKLDELAERPAIKNLVDLLAALDRKTVSETLDSLTGLRFSNLKRRIIDRLVTEIVPIGERMTALLEDPDHLRGILKAGSARASQQAEATMVRVRSAAGYN